MRLPARLLGSRADVLELVPGPPDVLGQRTPAWQVVQTDVPCAAFPAGARVLEVANLRGVRVSREVYVPRRDLNPQQHRVRVDGVPYQITLVSDWDGFTVLGVVDDVIPT